MPVDDDDELYEFTHSHPPPASRGRFVDEITSYLSRVLPHKLPFSVHTTFIRLTPERPNGSWYVISLGDEVFGLCPELEFLSEQKTKLEFAPNTFTGPA
jgi:hypothetical protein